MSVSRNTSISTDALLLLSMYLNPMSLILFASITTSVLPFQYPRKNRLGQHGGRPRYSGMNYAGRASTSQSPSTSPVYRIPKTFLGLSSDLRASESQFAQQQQQPSPSPGTAVNSRDMVSLSEWSRNCEIVLTDGVELTEDLLGDWSLTTTKSIEQGSSIMTVPAEAILTSDIIGDSFLPYYSDTDMQNIRDWMESELESGSQSKQDYLPEYMLVYKLLREVHMGTNSRWCPWLQSLPTQFSTGLYLDEVERNHVERMTGEYIRVQGLQYRACLELFQKLVSSQESGGNEFLIPSDFLEWILALQQDSSDEDTSFDSLVKWAFSIVFTRSWRSPDRKEAQIIPFGDLANHDSQFANLKPGFRQSDGAFNFFVTTDIDVERSISPKLYLSYGLTYAPARFLVIFGFCDVTAAYIDANLDFLPADDGAKWPTVLESPQLVASTLNGALSEEVWIAFLYKILQKSDPDTLTRIRNVFDNSEERGDKLVEGLLEKLEFEVGLEIQSYYQRLLETDFMPITVTKKDLAEHPNLSMIVNYNLFIRETYLNVLEHVNLFLTQCREFKELSASGVENELGIATPKSQEKLILNANQNAKFFTASGKSEYKKSYQPISGQNTSSESNYKDSIDTKPNFPFKTSENTNTSTQTPQESSASENSERKSFQSLSGPQPIPTDTKRFKNLPPKISQNTNTSEQTVQENISSDPASSISSENSNQEFITVQESRGMIDWKNATEMNDSKMDQPRFTQSEVSQEASNLNATSKFSFENFNLQSYSNGNPTSYDDNSDNYDGHVSPEIPPINIATGEFNPQYYAASLKGKTHQNIDCSVIPTMANDNVETQSYFGTISPDGNSNIESNAFGRQTTPTQEGLGSSEKPAFPYGNPNPQSYSLDQPLQEQIDATATPSFDFGYQNSPQYPNIDAKSSGKMVDSTESPVFPDPDIDFQPDADIGFRPDVDTDYQSYSSAQTVPDSTVTTQFDYGNSNAQFYSDGETTRTNGQVETAVTPDFPYTTNPDFRPYSDDRTIPPQGSIDSTATNDFPNSDRGSQSYGPTQGKIDLTATLKDVNKDPQSYSIEQAGSSEQKVAADSVTSYAQSLVSDQRGNLTVQQQSNGGTESSKPTNRDVHSTPTTYAEYVQQRQERQSGEGI